MKMAAQWDHVLRSLAALLPPDVAEYGTQVIAVAALTTCLAFLGQSTDRLALARSSYVYIHVHTCSCCSVAMVAVWREEG